MFSGIENEFLGIYDYAKKNPYVVATTIIACFVILFKNLQIAQCSTI